MIVYKLKVIIYNFKVVTFKSLKIITLKFKVTIYNFKIINEKIK